jgi:hypothetical protein
MVLAVATPLLAEIPVGLRLPVAAPGSQGSDMHPESSSRADFSLVAGGPTHRLQQRLGLIKLGSPHLPRRAKLSIVLTWVPLLVLSAAQGLAIGHDVRIPLLYDFAAYERFLVAIPLLIPAEGLIEHHIAGVAPHFMHSKLVPERQYPDYAATLDRAIRLRDSTLDLLPSDVTRTMASLLDLRHIRRFEVAMPLENREDINSIFPDALDK